MGQPSAAENGAARVAIEPEATVGLSTERPVAAPSVSHAEPPRPQGELGRYLIIEPIGRGGMGVVWRAYDPRLHREVAIKLLRPTEAPESSRDAHAQMMREAQAMAQLSHPNVVAVYDVERIGNSFAIAMEYVRGTTLKEWLQGDRRWREVAAMYAAAGRGLAAAHQVGILHRDFKPTNVLVGNDGRARVTDFGLARVHEEREEQLRSAPTIGAAQSPELTRSLFVLGTPRYMAPEQHEGEALTPAADQYAFCVALWEGLTGQPPFAGADEAALLETKRRGPPPWPGATSVPATLRDAIARGLASDPRARWPSLEALLDTLEVVARHRMRGWSLAVGIPPVLFVVGVTAAAWHAHQQRAAARCTGAQAQLESAWGPTRRDAVLRSFAATGLAYADDASRGVARALDRYLTDWTHMHTQACLATTVSRQQPPEILDLRMACLHRAKVELQAASDLLANADAQVVENAQRMITGLPELQRCGDIEALQAEVPPPNRADARAVEAIVVELAEVKALREAGKYPALLPRMQPLVERSRDVPYEPLHTKVLIELAHAWSLSEQYEAAERVLRQALRNALRCKQWREAELAASTLVDTVGFQRSRPAEAFAYAATAQALLDSSDATAQAKLRSSLGMVLSALGRYAEAEVEHRAAVAIAETPDEPQQLQIATYRGNLAVSLVQQGRPDEAEAEFREQLRVQEEALGPLHPQTASTRFSLASMLSTVQRHADAEAQHRLALAAFENNLGADHPNTAVARGALAATLAARGRAAEAEAEYRAALRVLEARVGHKHRYYTGVQKQLAKTLMTLARYEEAEALIREALAVDESTYGSVHPQVANSRVRLGIILMPQGKFVAAEREARLAVEVLTQTRGENAFELPQARALLGGALRGRGRLADAEVQLRTAMALALRTADAKRVGLEYIRTQLGLLLEAQGRYEAAEAEHRAALDLRIATYGLDDHRIALQRGRLANVLRLRGRYREAEAEYRRALAVARPGYDEDHPELADLERGLAQTLKQGG